MPFAIKKKIGVFIWLYNFKNDDTDNLNNVKFETLNNISIYYKDFIAPRLSSNKRFLIYGRLSDIFVTSIKLSFSNIITDAIIGGKL